MESGMESLAREIVDAWCTYHLLLIYNCFWAYFIIVSSQEMILAKSRLFKEWFEALALGQPPASWMNDYGIDDHLIHVLQQYMNNKAGPEGIQVCLVFAIRPLANNHLPPSRLRWAMKEEFKNGALHDLYARLEKEKGVYAQSFLDGINHLNGQQLCLE
jgi:hypothetical protein